MGLTLFDLDGTLISAYMDRPDRAFAPVDLLPGVRDQLRALVEAGQQVGVVTNQRGVAFGLVEPAEVETKLVLTAQQLGFSEVDLFDGFERRLLLVPGDGDLGSLLVVACYGDRRSPEARYADPVQAGRAKPAPTMLLEAMDLLDIHDPASVLYIGDMDSDREAAERAGVRFAWAKDYFGW